MGRFEGSWGGLGESWAVLGGLGGEPQAHIEQRRWLMLMAKPLQSAVPRTCVLYRFLQWFGTKKDSGRRPRKLKRDLKGGFRVSWEVLWKRLGSWRQGRGGCRGLWRFYGSTWGGLGRFLGDFKDLSGSGEGLGEVLGGSENKTTNSHPHLPYIL